MVQVEDTDESSSENNIEVLGISDFLESPHQINKKAYHLKLLFEKGSPYQYRSRLGFNLYKLPVGYYTMVVECFPPEMNELSVTVQATTILISNYVTKTFEKYTKTVINFHRWGSSPPQHLYLDLHGTVSNPSFLTIGHLIVYGVKETISNVDPSVYDTAFVIENGKMVMETDLSLNGHHLSGSVHYIHGILDTTQGKKIFSLNGCSQIIMNRGDIIKNIKIMYANNQLSYAPISISITFFSTIAKIDIDSGKLKITPIKEVYRSTDTSRVQTINVNLKFNYCCSLYIELSSSGINELLLMLLEYIVP